MKERADHGRPARPERANAVQFMRQHPCREESGTSATVTAPFGESHPARNPPHHRPILSFIPIYSLGALAQGTEQSRGGVPGLGTE